MKTTYPVDLQNIKVTNAIASVINGAFETGLNPEWYWVESLNKDGFLDAAFSDGEDDLEKCYTPSGKRPKLDWTFKGCLVNPDNYEYDGEKDEPSSDERESEIITVSPRYAVHMWHTFANDQKQGFLRSKADAYLRYLVALSQGDDKLAQTILFEQYEPDGVHDDGLAQYVFAGDVVFG